MSFAEDRVGSGVDKEFSNVDYSSSMQPSMSETSRLESSGVVTGEDDTSEMGRGAEYPSDGYEGHNKYY